jgi:endonuclease III related protein
VKLVKPQDRRLIALYKKLYRSFGPQYWWPGQTPFEVMVGAILTQNTSWSNVEKAIANLKKHKALSPAKLRSLTHRQLSRLIRPAGYYNIKAKRLKNFLEFLFTGYAADIKKMSAVDSVTLRRQLLSVNGIGPETADSILLYALEKPVFVVDAYTKRILGRQGLIKDNAGYDQLQALFSNGLKPEKKMFNEYHALLVKLAKDFCLKSKPKCVKCPIKCKQ